jgi:hypothetical protein
MTLQVISEDQISYIDSLVDLGIPQRKLGPKLGVHWRSIHAAYHRKGAYAKYPKPMPSPIQPCPPQPSQLQIS